MGAGEFDSPKGREEREMDQLSGQELSEKIYCELQKLNGKFEGVYSKLSDINNNIKAILDEIRNSKK